MQSFAKTPRIVLATVGSLGDLHPFIALGRALAAQGCEVVVAAAADYQRKVDGAGLRFHPVRPGFADLQRDLSMDLAQITRAARLRADFLFRGLVFPYLRVSLEDLRELVASADLVLTSSLAFGARLAAETEGVPWIAVVLQPIMLLSAFDPPVLPRAEWLTPCMRLLGPAVTGQLLRLGKRAVHRLFAPWHELRRALGLAPQTLDPLFDGQFAGAGVLGLYSPLLGEVPPDLPGAAAIAGFLPFDSEDGGAAVLDPALDDFLAAGAPPLVCTAGSTMVHDPGRFFHCNLLAARALGLRSVMLVGAGRLSAHRGLGGGDVHACEYAPHSLLFARAAAVVHHGGIGTLAQALLSGRPQLIVPFFADQADNAARAMRLGPALCVSARRLRPLTARRQLAALLADPGRVRRAAEVRDQLLTENGAVRAVELIRGALQSGSIQPSCHPAQFRA